MWLKRQLERGALSLLSGGGSHAPAILIYHRVLPAQDPLFPGEVHREQFERQLGWLKSRFKVLPLLDAVRLAAEGRLPARSACITFDDGYADNAEVALPVLQKHGLHATFFIATGFLDGGRMWNDTVIETVRRAPGDVLDVGALGLGRHAIDSWEARRSTIGALLGQLKYLPLEQRLQQVDQVANLAGMALPRDLMMSSLQLRTLHAAGMGIGGHTVNHPILARLPLAEARREIAQGRAALEAALDASVRVFAYPNGKPGQDYLPEHVAMVREMGFEAAVSTAWGASRGETDWYQLPRFTPWDQGIGKFGLRLARNMLQPAQRV
ncbi:polysaccharide deacetylase family protein [Duganella sp. Root198D2]|uniref:polysaccharide deacetylase family protein n=1 Tax=Duganella sp. Root198D2 TaxID=1736489 RepID=UPI000A9B295C|nr:polysaccharide deacetylase family protein [Duganella sp. Root198D2]